MLPRLQADVLRIRPVLVIWQVGANGAMKQADPALFRTMVASGVHTIADAQADVVLMDNQRAPAILSAPHHILIGQALADVAARTGAGLFSRNALMLQWSRGGHPDAEFISDDGIHHNDRGYRCVAQALAASIIEGLTAPARSSAMAAKR